MIRGATLHFMSRLSYTYRHVIVTPVSAVLSLAGFQIRIFHEWVRFLDTAVGKIGVLPNRDVLFPVRSKFLRLPPPGGLRSNGSTGPAPEGEVELSSFVAFPEHVRRLVAWAGAVPRVARTAGPHLVSLVAVVRRVHPLHLTVQHRL